MSGKNSKKTVFDSLKHIESTVLKLLKNHYEEEVWNSFSLERQIREIVNFIDDMDEIKSTSLDKLME